MLLPPPSSLQSEAAQGLPLLQTSCFLLLSLHLGSGPKAVRQHPPPAAPGPEDCLLLPKNWRCLAKGLSAAAPRHLHSCRERGLHAALPPRLSALKTNWRHTDASNRGGMPCWCRGLESLNTRAGHQRLSCSTFSLFKLTVTNCDCCCSAQLRSTSRKSPRNHHTSERLSDI